VKTERLHAYPIGTWIFTSPQRGEDGAVAAGPLAKVHHALEMA